jgi:hypothetical protein
MAGSNIFNNTTQEEDLFFWVIVQACRDIVYFEGTGSDGMRCTGDEFRHACEWIVDMKPQQIGDREYTFTEALLELGVHPENVEHIRYTICRGPMTSTKRRRELAKECYAKLEGQDNEPEPFWRVITNLIMNKEPDLDCTVQEKECEEFC